jgi:hypothetical protein
VLHRRLEQRFTAAAQQVAQARPETRQVDLTCTRFPQQGSASNTVATVGVCAAHGGRAHTLYRCLPIMTCWRVSRARTLSHLATAFTLLSTRLFAHATSGEVTLQEVRQHVYSSKPTLRIPGTGLEALQDPTKLEVEPSCTTSAAASLHDGHC